MFPVLTVRCRIRRHDSAHESGKFAYPSPVLFFKSILRLVLDMTLDVLLEVRVGWFLSLGGIDSGDLGRLRFPPVSIVLHEEAELRLIVTTSGHTTRSGIYNYRCLACCVNEGPSCHSVLVIVIVRVRSVGQLYERVYLGHPLFSQLGHICLSGLEALLQWEIFWRLQANVSF